MEDIEQKRGPGRPKAEQTDTEKILAMVMEQNRLLIEQMGKQNSDAAIALAAELRKPTELEQKKLDEEKSALVKRAEMAVNAAKAQEKVLKAKQSTCVHRDKNGITTFNGQVTSDGRWAYICSRCQLPAPRIKATDSERLNGVNIREWENVSYEGLQQLYNQRELAAV